MEYLNELSKEKKTLAIFPGYFKHTERLVDIELARVRGSFFQSILHDDLQKLPDPEPLEEKVNLQEKVYVPVKDYPDFNFVGRILGPRGMTAKQLEQETGCKIMVRGRGSMRDNAKEDIHRGKQSWEHLEDELHILVQCEDTEKRARAKLANAVEQVKKLLVPAPGGIDELKRKQLMELSIINGTYRPSAKKTSPKLPRLMPLSLSPVHPPISSPPYFHSMASNSGFGFGSPLPSPLKDFSGAASRSQSAIYSTGGSSKSAFEFNDLIKQLTFIDSTPPERSFRQHQQQYRLATEVRPIEGMPH